MKNLHGETLRVLMSIQYYMSTLTHGQDNVIKYNNYRRCLEIMKETVETLIKTTDVINNDSGYPDELLLIINKIANINRKIDVIKNDQSIKEIFNNNQKSISLSEK